MKKINWERASAWAFGNQVWRLKVFNANNKFALSAFYQLRQLVFAIYIRISTFKFRVLFFRLTNSSQNVSPPLKLDASIDNLCQLKFGTISMHF